MVSSAPFGEKIEIRGRDPAATLLNESAAIALSALNKLSCALAVIGPDGRILLRNPSFTELFGAEEWPKELNDCIDPEVDRLEPREIALCNGRTYSIVTVCIPQGVLVTAEDCSAQVAQKARAAEQARIDPLTFLGNSMMFRERLSELLANIDPTVDVAAVLTVNLDRFRAVNDSLGRPVGDALLCVAADRLRSALTGGDFAARFTADEFAIVQTSQSQPQSAAALAKRLIDLLSRSYIVEGHLLNIGASVGIALIPADGTECDQVLNSADLALYRAKQDGRGTYRFFETTMDEQMQARRSLEIDLRRVLAMRELALVYQPQFNLSSKRITGCEALLRWHCPKRGLVSPAQFIPLAEDIGLIVPIGEWVVRAACREAAGWAEPLNVAVNISAIQFGSPSLVLTILSALSESGLDPKRLELEITESVLLSDHSSALDVLHKVREMGVRVSMDDFGTGYSSLSYLRSFPFDKIKIDQSFVRGSAAGPSGMPIVRAIAALGLSLGMTTTAEGVETQEQLDLVAAAGCTDVQGYLISKPLPPEAIREFLRSQANLAAPAPV